MKKLVLKKLFPLLIFNFLCYNNFINWKRVSYWCTQQSSKLSWRVKSLVGSIPTRFRQFKNFSLTKYSEAFLFFRYFYIQNTKKKALGMAFNFLTNFLVGVNNSIYDHIVVYNCLFVKLFILNILQILKFV